MSRSNYYLLGRSCSPLFMLWFLLTTATASSFQTYNVDQTSGTGRRFDGIGGLSGGGATSKLLVNYPEKQRNEILDYLFKPGFGASLQILKVEIGGDAQSTDGSEASHMHNSWEENYFRGYEWWLLKEAKKRNPSIKLYCLPWGFPHWIGNGTLSPYKTPLVTATYVTKWILGAKTHHNLTMDYVGIWNERTFTADYIKILRKFLNTSGLSHVQIVAADGGWSIADAMLKDEELQAAVSYIGVHYPGTVTTDKAMKTGRPLWSSEDYSTFNDNVGAGCWARILNQNYVNGYMTSTISWNLIASYYSTLPFNRCGLMTAYEPWSGHYEVNSPIWVTAHTTHFAGIGWKYLKHDSGVGKFKKGGSYVSLVSPSNKDLTIVIETMSHNHSYCIRPALPKYTVEPQDVTIQLDSSFSFVKQFYIWFSELSFTQKASVLFQQQKPIPVINGQVNLTLGVDQVITLTTVKHDQPQPYGNVPPSAPFPTMYAEDFEGYPLYAEPYNFAQQTGSFEVVQVGEPYNKVMRQMVLETPVAWCLADYGNTSITVIGNSSAWIDTYVEVKARIGEVNGSKEVFIASRVSQGGCSTLSSRGVFLFVDPISKTYHLYGDIAKTKAYLNGTISETEPDWNKIGLYTKGGIVIGLLNEKIIFSTLVEDIYQKPGFVGLGTYPYGIADFDMFFVEEI
ncbi:galactocerebrosidase [Octopus sinensis]|uniref:galactosylceramidase n=1 Tax=Octopus sinensis TaxID=2607531 RepID=A0A6P7T7L8_9MOLL|nr:galactocerebrosidase [Octopus sinensis]